MKPEKWIQLLQMLGTQLQRFGEQPHATREPTKWPDLLRTDAATSRGTAPQPEEKPASKDTVEKPVGSRSRRRRRGESRHVSALLTRSFEITLATPEREFGRGEMAVVGPVSTAYMTAKQRGLSEAFRLIQTVLKGLDKLGDLVGDLDKRVRALEARADLTDRIEMIEKQLATRASDSEVLDRLGEPLTKFENRILELMTRLAALELNAPGGDAEP